jgi:alpha-N-arabinofuranosidase
MTSLWKTAGALAVLMTASLGASAGSAAAADSAPISAHAVVHGDQPGAVIDRHIYGQFSEHLGHGIYDGVWVGEKSPIPNTRGFRNDVIAALRDLKVPVLRWPGGCFADEYNWREGVGPRDKRPVRVNTTWGGVEEPNTVGTHEFFDFAEMIGAETYVNGDVGSADAREMAEWVEYITSNTRSTLANERRANGRDKPWALNYFGIGNETWGCGGHMRPEYAADVTRRYATFIKTPPEQHVMRVASGAHDEDFHFTEVMMRDAADSFDGLTYHYYTVPTGIWDHKGAATGFGEDQWISTLSRALMMDTNVTAQSAIMDKYDPKKRVALIVDEWGVWTDVEPGTNPGFLYQQDSLRDALVAAVTLNVFHKHADRVRMANIAQMVNVLQAMILTKGPQMVLTPTYHVFEMYKPFQDATDIPVEVDAPPYAYAGFSVPSVQISAARDKAGHVHVALVNLDPHRPAQFSASLPGVVATAASGRILTASAIDSVNSFEQPNLVHPVAFTAAHVSGGTLTTTLPPKSIVVLDLQ